MKTTTCAPRLGAALGTPLALGLLLAACDSPRAAPTAPAAVGRQLRDVQGDVQEAVVADSQYRLQAQHSGKCLSLAGTTRGVQLQQQTCADTSAQRFTLQSFVMDGVEYFRLRPQGGDLCVDINNNGTNDGALVIQWTCDANPAKANQLFEMRPSGEDSYYLVSKLSLKCVDVPGRSTADGVGILQWTCGTGPNQRFRPIPITGPVPPVAGGDGTSPVVDLVLERQSVTQAGPVTLTATASDNVGVARVVFRSGDGAVVGVDTTSPYTATLNLTSVDNGQLTISAQAYDAAGNVGTSTKTLTVSIGTGTTTFPLTIVDNIRPGGPVVARTFYDDDIAVYFGNGLDTKATWMNDYIRQAWQYMKQTYGSFGPDPRIYVAAHANTAFNYATVNTRFDAGFGYRNVIDLGGVWNWNQPQQVNYEVITHELAHIVEGGSKDTKESPSFTIWRDGPWPEIFVYDVYKALGRNDWAQDWYNRMLTNTNGSFSPDLPGQYYTFRDWFYPIYSQYGEAAVLNRYFTLLSQCFPKKDITVGGGQTAKEYARRANVGEFVHFWSGAAGVNLKDQFTKAYTWNSKFEGELAQAQQDFSCANTYPK